jgi:hypothetical protein
VLLVNRRDRAFDISIPGATGATMEYVDQTTAYAPPASAQIKSDTVKVGGLAVVVVRWR